MGLMPSQPTAPRDREASHARPSEAADDDRLTVMGLLAEAFGGLATRGAAQLAEHGMAPVEFEVLLRLTRSPLGLLRMTDLSAQTSLTTSGVTRVVDRLVDRGLVTRQACQTDRRTTYAVVTDAGRALLESALPGPPGTDRAVAGRPVAGRRRRRPGHLRAAAAPGPRPRGALRHRRQRRAGAAALPTEAD